MTPKIVDMNFIRIWDISPQGRISPRNLNHLVFADVLDLWKQYVSLPDDPVPRCGYFCLSTDWIYRIFGKVDPFLKCCMVHDIEYKLKRQPRSKVDRELYTCMKSMAGFNPILQTVALTYYVIVRTVGGAFW